MSMHACAGVFCILSHVIRVSFVTFVSPKILVKFRFVTKKLALEKKLCMCLLPAQVDQNISVSEYPLSAAYCLARITTAFEQKWGIV